MDLKSELLRQELSCESANSAKDSAERVIEERERQITNLHEELAKRERIIENQKTEVEKFMNSMVDRENTEVRIKENLILYYSWYIFYQNKNYDG